MLRRYYGKISKLPIDEFVGHDGELVVDDVTGKVYVMDGATYGGIELVGATPRFGIDPPITPTPGTLWYDPISGRTYIYFQDSWVDAAPNTAYTLPMASATVLGGIKVGNNLSINQYGVLNAEDGNYTLPTANNTVLGGVKVDNVSIVIDGSGVISANTTSIQSNISILFSNAAIQSSNIATLFSNAATQSSNISTLFSNAATQTALINTINANVAAANTAIANKTVSNLNNNGNTVSLGTDGNVTLPAGGSINYSNGASILVGIASINNYTLPVANASTLGGIKLGEGFSTDDSDKVTINKLYSTNESHPAQHYRLTLDTNGVVHLPDESIINGATLQVVPGTGELNYAALAAGPDSNHPQKTWIWADAFGASILTDSYISNHLWQFDNSGNVTLPASGSINYSNGMSILEGITSGSAPSISPPAEPIEGQLWYDTDSGRIYVYLGDSWVDASPPLASNIYDNSNVAAYLPSDTTIILLKSNARVQANSINTLIATAGGQQTEIRALRANITAANAAIITANVGMRTYVDDSFGLFVSELDVNLSEFTSQTIANLATQEANARTQATAINTLTANASAQQVEIRGLRANITAANAAIITANSSMKTYVDSVTTAWNANAVIQDSAINDIKANLALQIGNAITQTTSLNTLTANASAQETEVRDLRANITAANSHISTLETQVYANANVAVYLPTYSGSIGGSITVGAILQAPQYTKASNATGTAGQICWDSSYIYVCTATNTWKRVALTGGY